MKDPCRYRRVPSATASAPAEDEHDVPAEHLAQPRHGDDPGRPPRVVAREDGHHLDVRARPGPAQRGGDRDREERDPEAVLRLAAVPPAVAPPGALAAEVVPRGGLVT